MSYHTCFFTDAPLGSRVFPTTSDTPHTPGNQNFFRSVSLFRGLKDKDLCRLTAVFRQIAIPAGHVLCQEGRRVDYIYLIKRGTCRVLKAFVPTSTSATIAASGSKEVACGCSSSSCRHDDPTTPPLLTVTTVEAKQVTASGGHGKRGEADILCHENSGVVGGGEPVRYYDVGELRRKDFIGEGGFTAAASARAGELNHPVFLGDTRTGGIYLVSVVSVCGADVYAAKVADLLPLQAVALTSCWMEGQRREISQQ